MKNKWLVSYEILTKRDLQFGNYDLNCDHDKETHDILGGDLLDNCSPHLWFLIYKKKIKFTFVGE